MYGLAWVALASLAIHPFTFNTSPFNEISSIYDAVLFNTIGADQKSVCCLSFPLPFGSAE